MQSVVVLDHRLSYNARNASTNNVVFEFRDTEASGLSSFGWVVPRQTTTSNMRSIFHLEQLMSPNHGSYLKWQLKGNHRDIWTSKSPVRISTLSVNFFTGWPFSSRGTLPQFLWICWIINKKGGKPIMSSIVFSHTNKNFLINTLIIAHGHLIYSFYVFHSARVTSDLHLLIDWRNKSRRMFWKRWANNLYHMGQVTHVDYMGEWVMEPYCLNLWKEKC